MSTTTSEKVAANDASIGGVAPGDPAAFVAGVERVSNAYEAGAAAALYAPNARFESITDGALEVYRGTEEIAKRGVSSSPRAGSPDFRYPSGSSP